MSCWVAPLIAAEFLKVPIEQIHERIQAGTIPSMVENGFTFVDVLPEVENLPLPIRPPLPPPTFTLISDEELAALMAPLAFDAEDAAPQPDDDDSFELPHETDEAGEETDWSIQRARAAAAARRIAPRQIAA